MNDDKDHSFSLSFHACRCGPPKIEMDFCLLTQKKSNENREIYTTAIEEQHNLEFKSSLSQISNTSCNPLLNKGSNHDQEVSVKVNDQLGDAYKQVVNSCGVRRQVGGALCVCEGSTCMTCLKGAQWPRIKVYANNCQTWAQHRLLALARG